MQFLPVFQDCYALSAQSIAAIALEHALRNLQARMHKN